MTADQEKLAEVERRISRICRKLDEHKAFLSQPRPSPWLPYCTTLAALSACVLVSPVLTIF